MFEDQERLQQLVTRLEGLGFTPPKWSYRYNVPIAELAPCSSRRFLCDVVGYRDGEPVVVFELDGAGHTTDRQKQYDKAKALLLALHGVRLWRMWNSELVRIDGEFGRIFRRDVKSMMYAPPRSLASDWRRPCRRCEAM